jgi:hypothetical protein
MSKGPIAFTWADKVEQMDNVKRIKKTSKNKERKKTVHNGFEIFVGGLHFEDLDTLNAKTSVRFRLRDERRAKFVSMFDRFGEVLEVRSHWTKRFLFVVFKDEEVAEKVVQLLNSHEVISGDCG